MRNTLSRSVSVVVPAHNSAATIGEAVESVLAQSFTDHELVVVDDASSDHTVKEISPLLTNHPYSRIIELRSNLGPAGARNRGIAAAQGEWIAFLDADDAWLPERLAVQMGEAEKRPAVGMWCGGTEELEGRFAARTSNIEHRTSNIEVGEREIQSREIRLEDLAVRNVVATSTVLVKREVVEAVGGFDEGFRGPEDYDLWLRVAARCPVRKIERPLSRYRHVPGSLSLDDRTFLPQVLRVLDKAYGPGGALHGIPARRRAVAYQYLCGAWMAADRKDTRRAWSLYLRGLLTWPASFKPYLNLPWGRAKLFVGLTRALGRRGR